MSVDLVTPWQHIKIGEEVLNDLPEELDWLGVSKPMLVCSSGMTRREVLKNVVEIIGARVDQIFDKVKKHPCINDVYAGAERAKKISVDGLIAVGGASASDTAKGIAIALAEKGKIENYATEYIPPNTIIRKKLKKNKLPLIVIPTTASAGEITPSAGIIDNQDTKLLFSDPKIAARAVFYDLNTWRDVPPSVFNPTLMNAIAHNIEGIYSRETQPVAQAMGLESLSIIANVINSGLMESPYFDDLPLAVAMSGMVISNAPTGLHHALCHSIGSVVRCSHGDINSVLLPHVIEFNRNHAYNEIAKIEMRLSLNGHKPNQNLVDRFIDRICNLRMKLKSPTNLKDLGVNETHLDQIVDVVWKDKGLLFNPRNVEDKEIIYDLLRSAM